MVMGRAHPIKHRANKPKEKGAKYPIYTGGRKTKGQLCCPSDVWFWQSVPTEALWQHKGPCEANTNVEGERDEQLLGGTAGSSRPASPECFSAVYKPNHIPPNFRFHQPHRALVLPISPQEPWDVQGL